MTFKTKAIILKYQDWQEYNRLYTFYTSVRGKMPAIARGIRKIKSKQVGNLKPFAILEIMVAHGKKIDTLATAEIIEDFSYLNQNLLTLGLATFSTELVEALTHDGERDPRIFSLMGEMLSLLNINSQQPADRMKAFGWLYSLKLIQLLGYGPDFYQCLHCQKEVNLPYRLAPEKGGLVCGQHAGLQECRSISAPSMEILRLSESNELNEFLKTKIKEATLNELPLAIKPLIDYHLNRPLKSERFLATI